MKFNQIQVGGPNDCPAVTTTISSNEYNNAPFLRQGWLCPRCQKILSPTTDFCPFCSGNSNNMPYTVSDKTSLPSDDYWRKTILTSDDTFKIHPDSTVYTTAHNSIAGGSDYWDNTEKIWCNILKNISNIKEIY